MPLVADPKGANGDARRHGHGRGGPDVARPCQRQRPRPCPRPDSPQWVRDQIWGTRREVAIVRALRARGCDVHYVGIERILPRHVLRLAADGCLRMPRELRALPDLIAQTPDGCWTWIEVKRARRIRGRWQGALNARTWTAARGYRPLVYAFTDLKTGTCILIDADEVEARTITVNSDPTGPGRGRGGWLVIDLEDLPQLPLDATTTTATTANGDEQT